MNAVLESLSHKLNTQIDKADGWSDLIARPKNLQTFIWLRPLEGQWKASLPSLFWGRGMLLHQRNNPDCFLQTHIAPLHENTQQTYVFNCRDQKVMHDSKYPKSSHHSFKMWPRWKIPSDTLLQNIHTWQWIPVSQCTLKDKNITFTSIFKGLPPAILTNRLFVLPLLFVLNRLMQALFNQ